MAVILKLLIMKAIGSDEIQRVHKVREHFKLFIVQELQIIQISYTCHFEEKF
jgi:hypothetical protein